MAAGEWVQFAGLVGLDTSTGTLVEGGPGAETAQILKVVGDSLPDLGLTMGDLVVARIFTTRFDDFAAINAAWEAVFPADAPPARTAVGVSALPIGASVEIECLFHRPGGARAPSEGASR
jgi:2-iminobutanoate/2-iminopropanoate deaminase